MSTRAAARAISDHVVTAAARGRNVVRGHVIGRNPLRLELATSGTVLEVDDDFELSGSLTVWDDEHGIQTGDVLLLMHEAGDYTAFDIAPAKKPKAASPATLARQVASLEKRLKALGG